MCSKLVSLIVIAVIQGASVLAADVSLRLLKNENVVEFKGKIESGDAQKLELAIAKIDRILQSGGRVILLLDSPEGGDFYESIKIAKLLISLGVATSVPDKAQCVSACAFILFAGTRNVVGEVSRKDASISPSSRVCFHRPFLTDSAGTFDEGVEAIAQFFSVFLATNSRAFLIEVVGNDRNNCKEISTINDLTLSGLMLQNYRLPKLDTIEGHILLALNYHSYSVGSYFELNGPWYCGDPEECEENENAVWLDPVHLSGLAQLDAGADFGDGGPFVRKLTPLRAAEMRDHYGSDSIFFVHEEGNILYSYIVFEHDVRDALVTTVYTVLIDRLLEDAYIARGKVNPQDYNYISEVEGAIQVPIYLMYPVELPLARLAVE